MIIPVLLIIVGLAILIAGGELLVRGASSMAKKLGVSPLVIGLTVVAFGTSAPELAVNIFSAIKGTADIAIGNVIGSNISNILLILGICGLAGGLKVHNSTIRKEIPFALLAAILVFVLGNDALLDGTGFSILSRTDGIVLMAFFLIFLYYAFGIAKVQKDGEEKVKSYSWLLSIILLLLGLVGLVAGGKLLVDNAVILARLAGLSEVLIGLTIVAVGTSLPELVTSLIALRHGHDDLAVGNIIGSNIFNVFWILGLTSTILPLQFNPAVNLDLLVNIGATVILLVFMFIQGRRFVEKMTSKTYRIDRWEGGILVVSYILYITFLIYRG